MNPKGKNCSIAALILGCLEAGQPTGLATAGLVLSIIGLTLSAISFFTCTLCVTCVGFVL